LSHVDATHRRATNNAEESTMSRRTPYRLDDTVNAVIVIAALSILSAVCGGSLRPDADGTASDAATHAAQAAVQGGSATSDSGSVMRLAVAAAAKP
jgi:hypothetical protein